MYSYNFGQYMKTNLWSFKQNEMQSYSDCCAKRLVII